MSKKGDIKVDIKEGGYKNKYLERGDIKVDIKKGGYTFRY